MNNIIDFIILWVDDTDKEWLKEKNKYYQGEVNQNKNNVYRDWELLKYWFRGVEKYTPWVNKIHFVTCGHTPRWLNLEHPKINFVKHEDYIEKEYLPTFSANAIELGLHKIPNLAEQFVYFNDDTFIINPMKKEDFFQKGLPCDSAIMSATIPSVKDEIFTYILFNDLLYINANFDKKKAIMGNIKKWFNIRYGKGLLKNLYYFPIGRMSGFENRHLPNAYLKKTFTEVWNKEEDIIRETMQKRFRTKGDINQYIYRYWQLMQGNFMPRNPNIGKCFVVGEEDEAILDAIMNKKYKMLCINDNPQSIDFEKEKEKIHSYFQRILPKKSKFEV